MKSPYYDEAVELLAQLDGAHGRLRDNQKDFVDKLAEKIEEYGERAFISEKQIDWLRGIVKAHAINPNQMSFL